MIDDGHGIPDSHRDLILEPGVTTRHLDPVTHPKDPPSSPHGAGLSLYQIKARSLTTRVLSASNPTSIQATFDTHTLPERALQSATRPSRTNLRATLLSFAAPTNHHRHLLQTYYGPPARILATLLRTRIIQPEGGIEGLRKVGRESGPVSLVEERAAGVTWRGAAGRADHGRFRGVGKVAARQEPARSRGAGGTRALVSGRRKERPSRIY